MVRFAPPAQPEVEGPAAEAADVEAREVQGAAAAAEEADGDPAGEGQGAAAAAEENTSVQPPPSRSLKFKVRVVSKPAPSEAQQQAAAEAYFQEQRALVDALGMALHRARVRGGPELLHFVQRMLAVPLSTALRSCFDAAHGLPLPGNVLGLTRLDRANSESEVRCEDGGPVGTMPCSTHSAVRSSKDPFFH